MLSFIGNLLNSMKNQFFLPQVNEGMKIDFTTSSFFAQKFLLIIFSHLNSIDLRNCCLTNKRWCLLASHENLWNALILKEKAFGKKQWETYFGDVGKVPSLPKDIYKILKEPCPFFPGKKVGQSHTLVLIPETVNGKPLTLKYLVKLGEAPKEGKVVECHDTSEAIVNNEAVNHVCVSYWALMTREVIPGSRNKRSSDQSKMIGEMAMKREIRYQVPTVMDAVICIFMHYKRSGERLFNDTPFTYIRCAQYVVGGADYVVGGFSPYGLRIKDMYAFFESREIGIAAIRIFY